jgi:hypothetical protein
LELCTVKDIHDSFLKQVLGALCTIDRKKMHLSNTVFLPNGNTLCSRNVARKYPNDMAVLIHTGPTGIVNGCILGDYSLVALPGSKFFKRMWIVILDRPVRKFSQILIATC